MDFLVFSFGIKVYASLIAFAQFLSVGKSTSMDYVKELSWGDIECCILVYKALLGRY